MKMIQHATMQTVIITSIATQTQSHFVRRSFRSCPVSTNNNVLQTEMHVVMMMVGTYHTIICTNSSSLLLIVRSDRTLVSSQYNRHTILLRSVCLLQSCGNYTMHGKGTCKYSDGTIYTGGYSNNKFHGVGHLKLTNGQEHFGIWDNHNLVQRFDHRSHLLLPSPPPTPEKHYPGSRVTL